MYPNGATGMRCSLTVRHQFGREKNTMSTKPIQFEVKGDTGIICFDRPDVHNVVDDAVIEQLESILALLDSTASVRSLIRVCL